LISKFISVSNLNVKFKGLYCTPLCTVWNVLKRTRRICLSSTAFQLSWWQRVGEEFSSVAPKNKLECASCTVTPPTVINGFRHSQSPKSRLSVSTTSWFSTSNIKARHETQPWAVSNHIPFSQLVQLLLGLPTGRFWRSFSTKILCTFLVSYIQTANSAQNNFISLFNSVTWLVYITNSVLCKI